MKTTKIKLVVEVSSDAGYTEEMLQMVFAGMVDLGIFTSKRMLEAKATQEPIALAAQSLKVKMKAAQSADAREKAMDVFSGALSQLDDERYDPTSSYKYCMQLFSEALATEFQDS